MVRIKAPNSANASKRKHKKIKLISTINKDEFSWLILLCDRVNESPIVEHRRVKPKTNRQAPTPTVSRRGRHWVWGPNRRRAIKEWRNSDNTNPTIWNQRGTNKEELQRRNCLETVGRNILGVPRGRGREGGGDLFTSYTRAKPSP